MHLNIKDRYFCFNFITILVAFVLYAIFYCLDIRAPVFGMLFSVFLVGYAFLFAVFKSDEIGVLERFTLSIGFSFTLLPISGVILAYTIGLDRWTIFFIQEVEVAAFLTVGTMRKHSNDVVH
jgi:uncharacterized membrane protein